MKGRIKYLSVGMLGLLFSGILYSWSILKEPFASEFGWKADQLGLNFTITVSLFSVGVFIGGRMIKKFSVRRILTITAICVFIGFVGCSQLTGESIVPLYIFYGGFCGIGIGISYNVIISATTAWFTDKRGLCSGMLMMCFGVSTLILGSLATSMIAMIGWRKSYLIIGVIIGSVLFFTALSLKSPQNFHTIKSNSESVELKGYSPSQIVKMWSFWLFCLYIITLCSGANMVISFGSDISIEIGVSEKAAVVIVGLLSIFNGLGRMCCGYLCDRLPIKKVMIIDSVIALIAIITICLALVMQSIFAGIAGMVLIGLGYGFSPTIIATFCSKMYGTEFFPENFSLASFTLIPCSFSASIAGTMYMLFDNYVVTMLIGGILSVVSIFFAIIVNFKAGESK